MSGGIPLGSEGDDNVSSPRFSHLSCVRQFSTAAFTRAVAAMIQRSPNRLSAQSPSNDHDRHSQTTSAKMSDAGPMWIAWALAPVIYGRWAISSIEKMIDFIVDVTRHGCVENKIRNTKINFPLRVWFFRFYERRLHSASVFP
jgi:hypothetical protein